MNKWAWWDSNPHDSKSADFKSATYTFPSHAQMDRFKGSLLREDKTLILSIDTKGFANRKLYLSNFQRQKI